MINPINFFGNINIPTQKTKYSPLPKDNKDSFVSTQTPLQRSIQQARAKIIDVLNKNNNEYCIAISPDGVILLENEGDSQHCTFNSRKIVPNAMLIHGHPIELPLSSGDVAVLLATDAKSQEAVTKDGKYSRLTKNHPFIDIRSYIDLYPSLEKQLCEAALDQLGIDYKLTQDDIMDMFKDHLEYQTGMRKENISDEKAEEYMKIFGISPDNNNLDKTYEQLKELMAFQLLTNPNKYDKAHHAIVANNDKIQEYFNTPDGLKLRHEFLIQLAKDYDLTYETNMQY